MKHLFFVVLYSLFSSITHASGMTGACGDLEIQLAKVPADQRAEMENMLRSMNPAMGKIIDDCAKEDTSAYVEKMSKGTLYCRSGSLCASYDFSHASDRKLYEGGCSQTSSCSTSGVKDSCTVRGDKVRGGKGTVDWTIYSYSGVMPP